MGFLKRFLVYVLIVLFLLPSNWSSVTFPTRAKAAPPSASATKEIAPPKSGQIELTEKRTATSKTYLKSDGKKEMVVYQGPVHYQDSKKQWQEINTDLQDSKMQINPIAPKEYENTANNFRVSLSENLAQKAFSLQKNDAEVDLKLNEIKSADGTSLGFAKENLNSIKPEKYQNRLTYKNVYKDTDIIYYSMASGLKEDIVLGSYSGQNQFVFDLNISNASYEKQKDGSYIFYKPGTKEIQFRMPKFYMWDNLGGKDSESNQYSYDVGTEIIDNNGALSVVLTANNNWLSSKDRVFPITIDPSFVTNDIEDTYVQTGYPDTLAWNQRALWVGQGSTKGIMRTLTLFNIPVPDLYGMRISSSRFEVLQYGNCSGICTSAGVSAFTTPNFNPWEITWNNRPGELAKVGNASNTSTWDWFVMDITSAAQHWIYSNNDGSVPGGLEFIQDGESNWGFRTWAAQNNPDYPWGQPRLVIDYNDYNIEYIPTNVPNMIAGTTSEVPVTLNNIGRNTWTKDQFKLSYHLINNSTGEQVIFDGLRTDLPKDVVKGDSVSVLAKLRAPPVSGNYTIQWDMVQEGVTWFSDQGLSPAGQTFNVSPPSFSSMTHLGTESYYAKAGPVDLANGNLSYSSADLSVASATGGLNVGRSYNSNTLDQTFSADSQGFIRTWLLNGPYKENNDGIRLTRQYIPGEDTVRPSEGSTSSGNLWFKNDSDSNVIDLNNAFDKIGAVQTGRAANMAAYANVYVYSPTIKNLKLKTGSNDGIKIWLGGIVKRSNDVYREITIDSDVGDVRLSAGWNTLLIKVTQGTGSWNVSTRFTNLDGTPVSDLKYTLNYPEVFSNSKISAKGWTFNFDQRLFVNDSQNIYYRDGTGTINIFTKNPDGSYNTPPGSNIKLTANADHSFTFTYKSGLKTNFYDTGRIANSFDLLGNKIEYQYDSSSPKKCIKIVDGSRYIIIAYTGDKVSSVADQIGNKISYTYDFSGNNLIRVTDPNNVSFSYEYGSDGKMVIFKDKMSNPTQISYSGGKVSQLTDSLGNTTKFNYSDKSTETTDALGKKSSAGFNEVNLLTSFTNAKNYKELYTYDGKYNTVSVIPAIPENDQYYYKWSYAYDGENNLLSETNPDDTVTSYLYSKNDLIKATDPKGNYSQYTYSTDGKRLLLSSTDPTGNKNSYSYDSRGRVVSATDPKGAITKYSYSTDGDLLTLTTPKNEVTRYVYDALGRKITEISPMGFVTKYGYDKSSRLTQVVDPAGLKVSYFYDVNDNEISETYPNSTKKSFAYDKLNRLLTVTDETGAKISYSYNAVGNKVSLTDANGKITRYTYDELNQLTAQTDPTGKTVKVNYDRNGNVSGSTDQKGNTTTNTYDKSGVLTSTNSGGVKSDLTLDANKNVTKVSTSNEQTTTVDYDKNDNPTQKTSTILGSETATYDKSEQVVAVATATATIDFVRDSNGSVSSVTTKLTKTGTNLGTTNYSADSDGKLRVITKPNADTATFSYDNSGRVVKIDNKNKAGATQDNFSYTYDLASNQTSITDNTGKKLGYAYDARNELITEGTKKYAYDPMGNRKTITDGTKITKYEYDTAGDANRLKKVTYPDGRIVSYDYDDNGNITKETDSKNGITVYAYDSDNYFTKATLPDKTTVEYTYDQTTKLRAQRILTTPTGVTTITKFVYSADRLVSETDTDGNVLKNYTWDEQENLISFTIPVGSVMTTYYYVKNAKGDVVGLSDKDGKMVVAYEYDAWGNITTAKNLVTTGIPTDLYKQNPRLYGSYWYDSTLSLYFMKTRLYDSELGRFLSKDQTLGGGSALGFNPYLYCNNNPVSRIDPNGKSWWSVVAGAIVGVAVAVVAVISGAAIGLAVAIAAAAGAVVGAVVGAYEYHKQNKGHTSLKGYTKATSKGAVQGATGGAVGGAIAAVAVQAAIAYIATLGSYSPPPSVTTTNIAQNQAKGLEYEKAGLDKFELMKNTQALRGGSIPDSTTGGVISEFKNAQYISNSAQFRNYAADPRSINLYAPSAARVSTPLQNIIFSSGGEIIKFDLK